MTWRAQVRMRLGELHLDVEIGGADSPVALIGPNGSGKTTLLRTIAGAHHPNAGTIRVGDRVLFDSERGVSLPPEDRRVGYVPQGYGLFPHLTVVDNVAFGWSSRSPRTAVQARRKRATEVLDELGCVHLADRGPKTLSGGEQQRVALARALMIDPHILLLDEPLSALDAPARRSVRAHLAAHLEARSGPAVIVTHDARDVRALDAQVYVLEWGKVVQHGSHQELSARPATEFVAEFFQSDAPVGVAVEEAEAP